MDEITSIKKQKTLTRVKIDNDEILLNIFHIDIGAIFMITIIFMIFIGFLMVIPIAISLVWCVNHPQGLLHK